MQPANGAEFRSRIGPSVRSFPWYGVFLAVTLPALRSFSADRILFEDPFIGQLKPGWSWSREDPKSRRLSASGLEVRVLPGNMWGPQNDAQNVLLRPIPEPMPAELAFSVIIENTPTHQYEQSDLVWYYDDSNMVKIGQEMVDGQRSIVMGREEKDRTRTIAILPLATDQVQLQLIVKANQIRGRFRPAGTDAWREAGECDLPSSTGRKPQLSLQFYQGSSEAEQQHWSRATHFIVQSLNEGNAGPGQPDFSK